MKPSIKQQSLSYLVFEAHALRMGLEFFLCLLLYFSVSALIPSLGVKLSSSAASLLSWFLSCSLVLVIDQHILCRSVYVLRRAYLLGLAGACDKATDELEKIAPDSGVLVPLPASLYHLQRSEFYAAVDNFVQAHAELELANKANADALKCLILKSRYYRKEGRLLEAQDLLQQADNPESAVIVFELGLSHLEQEDGIWKAKLAFKAAMELPEESHFSGETSYQLAKAYFNLCRLKTGEAEEGLQELEKIISRFTSATYFVDTLRPVTSHLLLERSMYYATHKEPAFAVLDLRQALRLCQQPGTEDRGNEIKDELAWRHQMLLA